jgi:hypothetical protein
MIAAAVALAACSSRDTVGPSEPQGPSEPRIVTLSLAIPPGSAPGNGFYIPSDTVLVNAVVIDTSGSRMLDPDVEWQLQSSDPTKVSLTKTGRLSARLVFSTETIVGVQASVKSDGTKVSNTIFVSWPSQ